MYSNEDIGTTLVNGEVIDEQSPTVDQITPEMITLAMLPKSQWQGLVHFDTIKVCPCIFFMIACLINGGFVGTE